jgi:hypothetical protein
VIPALGIDSRVGTSEVIPFLDVPPPGCPGEPKDTTTLTVPNSGITTPVEAIEGLENKAWVLGHSRWAGVNQLLYALQDINLGDEVIIDGIDRTTGESLADQRFVVGAIYLTDIDSGEALINATGPQDIPRKPTVILQTSVREQSTTQWILNRQKVTSKAQNLVEGSLDDPCKYLLLFVYATAA